MMAEFLPVRLSHLLRFCAPGSIVRGADGLLVPMDTRYWVNEYGRPRGKLIQRVNRLRSALGIEQELRFPPVATMNRLGLPEGNTLPAVRFPGWMRCSNCGRIYRFPWIDQQEGVLRCTNKKCGKPGRLVQVPWVLAHEKGYLDDVPWHWLAHRHPKGRDQRQCRDYKHLHLKMDKDSWKVYCTSCKAQENIFRNAILAKKFFSNYRKMQQQPWIRERVSPDEIEDVAPVAIEIGDSRIYSPITQNGLVIPPESRIDSKSIVARLGSMQDELDGLRRVQKRPSLLRSRINKLSGKLRCTPEEVQQAWELIESDYLSQDEETNITPGQLSELEYEALITVIPDLRDDEDFVTHHYSEEWRMLEGSLNPSAKVRKIIRIIDQVVSVQRLREIMIYKGFQRPVGGYSDDLVFIPPDLEGKQDWLPALELFGEGIFITINESILHVWEQNKAVIDRAGVMQLRKDGSHLPIPLPDPIPRFILLHTLAHLMIRQIEFDSGYPAASLKERLYVQEPIGGNVVTMAGILIYVSVPDKAGSLGGLAELAEPKRLLPVLEKVFVHADWCSLDPICTEHDGQGPGLLNRAACHACVLVPDTSCSYSNVLLDRVFIKGSTVHEQSSTIPPFLDYVDRVSL